MIINNDCYTSMLVDLSVVLNDWYGVLLSFIENVQNSSSPLSLTVSNNNNYNTQNYYSDNVVYMYNNKL